MLLTVATVGQLAQVAMELVVGTVSSEHQGNVVANTTSTEALDWDRPGSEDTSST